MFKIVTLLALLVLPMAARAECGAANISCIKICTSSAECCPGYSCIGEVPHGPNYGTCKPNESPAPIYCGPDNAWQCPAGYFCGYSERRCYSR